MLHHRLLIVLTTGAIIMLSACGGRDHNQSNGPNNAPVVAQIPGPPATSTSYSQWDDAPPTLVITLPEVTPEIATDTPTPTNTPLPPTDTPTSMPVPTNTPTTTSPQTSPTPTPQTYQFTPTGWHASGNKAIVHFRGTIRDKAGSPVNGYSILVDNGSWRVLSHPSGASHHYPDRVDGEWDVVIPDPKTGVGWWTLTVVRYECPDFEQRFDAQCQQFSRLSEDIKVEIVWPDETIVWADWLCHWDCDKGLYAQAYRRP
jgi:hypothetical protein